MTIRPTHTRTRMHALTSTHIHKHTHMHGSIRHDDACGPGRKSFPDEISLRILHRIQTMSSLTQILARYGGFVLSNLNDTPYCAYDYEKFFMTKLQPFRLHIPRLQRFNQLKRGRTDLTGRLREGLSSAAATEDNVSAVRLEIETDKIVTYQQIQNMRSATKQDTPS
ncbi:hypothetical protein EVAR_74230_1 [Eumeta japonica]|uniref:Uncharacterized protein n=1 Tax=Eumeta variegata TaxID=151549 RepID=A0A4C1SFE4_EUMVA|nr:hypothetical protein EVAR_74230_1 [Eumeta japonica]